MNSVAEVCDLGRQRPASQRPATVCFPFLDYQPPVPSPQKPLAPWQFVGPLGKNSMISTKPLAPSQKQAVL